MSKLLDLPYVTGLVHPPSPVTGAISADPVSASSIREGEYLSLLHRIKFFSSIFKF